MVTQFSPVCGGWKSKKKTKKKIIYSWKVNKSHIFFLNIAFTSRASREF